VSSQVSITSAPPEGRGFPFIVATRSSTILMNSASAPFFAYSSARAIFTPGSAMTSASVA
jgi:hypothetical protein